MLNWSTQRYPADSRTQTQFSAPISSVENIKEVVDTIKKYGQIECG